MSSPEKKKPSLTPRSTPKPSLPDDLLLSCVARLSRLYYPTLSLVSKSFRSLLVSPELWKARSLLGHTEICLYVCLKFYPLENPRWFTLCRKPDQTLTKVNVSYALATIKTPQSPAECTNLVAVGSNIYNIGGYGPPSSNVSVLDCLTHTWHEAPSLRVKVMSHCATVVDQKIYVSGYEGGLDNFHATFEVFDTKTQIWDPMPSPCRETIVNKNVCFNGKLHAMSDKGVASYNSKEGRWDEVGPWENYARFLDGRCCEIENVLYSLSIVPYITWHDTEAREWRKLEGLVGLPEFPPEENCVRLVNYGGKMVVLWDEDVPCSWPGGSNSKKIWCAEIAVEKHERFKLWGKVVWFDIVLTVPPSYKFIKGLVATF